ncbi:MAG: hypothetical protein Q9N26_06130 [Aquificota bacterium]|nr:hypothetical protein [Aquificota bacterium]
MRFYGIPSEERFEEIIESVKGGEWVFEEVKEGRKETLPDEEVKRRLREIADQIKRWKEEFSTLARTTVFAFVHEPENPKAFKIYDPSSLGCSTELTPPRWKVYLRDLEGEV